MISVPKTQLIKAVTQAVPKGTASSVCKVATATSLPSGFTIEPAQKLLTSFSLAKNFGNLGELRVSSALAGSTQARFAHTDIVKCPDFSNVRKSAVNRPDVASAESAATRKLPSYMMMAGACAGVVYMAKAAVRGVILNLEPGKDVLAVSKIEINLDNVPEGKNMTFKWRGKPLFVRHRVDEEIEREQAVDVSSLRDPQPDSVRASNPKYLIVIGVCTHLGCVPIADAGDFGGYYCPCHGSHYDGSGRIRKGPAPLNLEVPPITYLDDSHIVVGD